MEQTQELIRVLEEAKEGYWLPLMLLAGFCGLIVTLLIIIGKMILKKNDSEHVEMRELIKTQGEGVTLAHENQTALREIIIDHRVQLKEHEVEIEHIKEKVKK